MTISDIGEVISFWVVCLNIISFVSDSQPLYSVGLLYHVGAAVCKVLFTVLQTVKIIIILLILSQHEMVERSEERRVGKECL